MILYEVLRLYPPVIAQYQHARMETKIGDISLPAGVMSYYLHCSSIMIPNFGEMMQKNSNQRDSLKEFQRHQRISWHSFLLGGAQGPVLAKLLPL